MADFLGWCVCRRVVVEQVTHRIKGWPGLCQLHSIPGKLLPQGAGITGIGSIRPDGGDMDFLQNMAYN